MIFCICVIFGTTIPFNLTKNANNIIIIIILAMEKAMSKFKDLLRKNKEIILYLIVGALTTLISFVVQWFFKDVISLPFAFLSTFIAWAVSVLFAFFANKIIVFEKKEKKGFFIELILFYTSRILTGALEIGAMALFVDVLLLNYWAIKIIANIVIIILNYVLSKFIVFRKDKENK